jgi:hypothetical protein
VWPGASWAPLWARRRHAFRQELEAQGLGGATAGLALPAKLFRVEMIHDYTGIIEGEGVLQYLVANNGDNTGCFLALEQITGSYPLVFTYEL